MFVTFSLLNNYGQLCNQIFNISACIGYARKYNIECILPDWKYSSYFDNNLNYTLNVNEIKNVYNKKLIGEIYEDIPLLENVDLRGYYISGKFFNGCDEEIKSIFRLKREYLEELKRIIYNYDKDFFEKETLSIHVRRTDYIPSAGFYNNLSLTSYYEDGINYILNLKNIDDIYVFSDDINWCKNNFLKNRNVIYVENNANVIDLFFIANCKNNINANSSYSWWGSFLNKNLNKIVIAPKKYLVNYETPDLVRNDMVLI